MALRILFIKLGMISWIQKKLIKNGKWIFSILLAVIIVAFVFVIGETPGLPTGGPGSQKLEFYGLNLLNRNQLQQMDQQTSIATMMRMGSTRYSAQNIRQLTYYRAASLHLADHYKIPVPSREVLEQYLLDMPIFKDENGQFDADTYQAFLDNVKSDPTISEGLIDRAIQDEYRIEQLSSLLSNQSYTLPYDVALLTEQRATRWSVEVAARSYDNFNPDIEIDEEELQSYFDYNAANYEIPKKQLLSWIYFDPESYIDEVEDPDDEVLMDYLDAHFYRYLNAGEDRDPENPDQVMESEALLQKKRGRILADWKSEKAREVAREKAEDFAIRLYTENKKRDSEEIQSILEGMDNEKGRFNPVGPDTTPSQAGTGATRGILQATRGLNSTQWFTDAVEFRNGYAVILLDDTREARIPELNEVRKEVVEDYRESLREKEFINTGSEIAEAIRENLASTMNFRHAVAHTRLKKELSKTLLSELSHLWKNETPLPTLAENENFPPVVRYDNISPNSHPEQFPARLFSSMQGKEAGEVTDMVFFENTGYFTYIIEKVTPALDPESEDYKRARENLEFTISRYFVRNAMRELLDRGAPDNAALPGMAN